MEKNTRQLNSEIWDSMNYTMPDTGYVDRAMVNGVIDACGGELPELSFDNLVENLRPYFAFGPIKGGGLGDTYVRGRGISSDITVEVIFEADSDLTKRLNAEEENKLFDILEGNTSDAGSRLMELGGWSVPLISVKLSYSEKSTARDLELIRKTLLISGLEKV